jgi:hypothetical protein
VTVLYVPRASNVPQSSAFELLGTVGPIAPSWFGIADLLPQSILEKD